MKVKGKGKSKLKKLEGAVNDLSKKIEEKKLEVKIEGLRTEKEKLYQLMLLEPVGVLDKRYWR